MDFRIANKLQRIDATLRDATGERLALVVSLERDAEACELRRELACVRASGVSAGDARLLQLTRALAQNRESARISRLAESDAAAPSHRAAVGPARPWIRPMDSESQREVARLAGVHRNHSPKVCSPTLGQLLSAGHTGLQTVDGSGLALVSVVGGRSVPPKLTVQRFRADGRPRTRGKRGGAKHK